MKRLAVYGTILLLVAFTVAGCAGQSSYQWDVTWDKTGTGNNRNNNINYQVQGGGGNGLF